MHLWVVLAGTDQKSCCVYLTRQLRFVRLAHVRRSNRAEESRLHTQHNTAVAAAAATAPVGETLQEEAN